MTHGRKMKRKDGMKKTEILIVGAMEKELLAFRKGIKHTDAALLDGCLVGCSGIGKVSAALYIASMVELARPDIKAVVSFGCAGALHPKLGLGDVVVSNQSGYWDVFCGIENEAGQVQGMPRWFEADRRLSRRIGGAIRDAGKRVFYGDMLTGDLFFEVPGSEKFLHDEHPRALTVDMETAAMAHACYRLNIPFTSVRVVSDTFGGDRKAEYERFWKSAKKSGFNEAAAILKGLAAWRGVEARK